MTGFAVPPKAARKLAARPVEPRTLRFGAREAVYTPAEQQVMLDLVHAGVPAREIELLHALKSEFAATLSDPAE